VLRGVERLVALLGLWRAQGRVGSCGVSGGKLVSYLGVEGADSVRSTACEAVPRERGTTLDASRLRLDVGPTSAARTLERALLRPLMSLLPAVRPREPVVVRALVHLPLVVSCCSLDGRAGRCRGVVRVWVERVL